jgi:hypothetical protein
MLTISAVWALAPGPSQQPPDQRRRPLHITGHVRELYPGKTATLVLRVKNPMDFPIKVTRLVVRVGTGTGPNGTCSARTLKVRPWKGVRRVPAHVRRKIRLQVKMRSGAAPSCIGTRYPLFYYAKAIR